MRVVSAAAILVASLLAGTQASAGTILDTIGGAPFNPGGPALGVFNTIGPGGSLQQLAIPFTVGATTTISSIEAYVASTVPGQVSFILEPDSGGVPSNTISFFKIASTTTAPVQLTSLNWTIAAGTYWLIAGAIKGDSATWQVAGSGTYAITTNLAWSLVTDSPVPMARITDNVAAVPCPAVGLPGLMAACGALLAWSRRRRQNA